MFKSLTSANIPIIIALINFELQEIFRTQYTRILIICSHAKIRVSSSSVLLLISTKQNLKIIFASCYIRFNIAMTKVTYFCSAIYSSLFQNPKVLFLLHKFACPPCFCYCLWEFTLRLWSGITRFISVFHSVFVCVCVCVFWVLSGEKNS